MSFDLGEVEMIAEFFGWEPIEFLLRCVNPLAAFFPKRLAPVYEVRTVGTHSIVSIVRSDVPFIQAAMKFDAATALVSVPRDESAVAE
ncbi:hypothetical protein [Gryllotalpicola protaetiae]|nr:hypothetical protein [Gryllotalpicola protaetiae]